MSFQKEQVAVVIVGGFLGFALVYGAISDYVAGSNNQTETSDSQAASAEDTEYEYVKGCSYEDCPSDESDRQDYQDYKAEQAQADETSSSCNIKGNVSYNTGEKIYHVPGQKYYEATSIDSNYGERMFCSEQEAVNAGWRKSYE